MKILLINPPGIYHKTEVPAATYPPLGLGYIAAVLEQNGFEVRILDASLGSFIQLDGELIRYGLSDEEIDKILLEFEPQLIGISASFSSNIKLVHHLATRAKILLPGSTVIVGGTHASIVPHEMLQNYAIDVVVIGEGELTCLEIAKYLEDERDFRSIDGIAIRDSASSKEQDSYPIVINKPRRFIDNLDFLPYPARHLFVDFSLYNRNLLRDDFFKSVPIFSMITSRGCIFDCVFCSYRTVFRGSWRPRTVEETIGEIEHLIGTYGAREIHFQDDNMNIDKKRMHLFCDEILRSGIKINWVAPNGLAVMFLDEELVMKMKRSGCYRIGVGLESGCQKTLKFINKKIDLAHARHIIHFANDIGLWTQACFVIGFPYETKEDMQQTLDYALSLSADISIFNIATPYCGTRLRKILEEEGLYNPNNPLVYLSPQQASFTSKYLSKEVIKSFSDKCFDQTIKQRIKLYLNHPSILIKKCSTVSDIIYIEKLFLRFITALRNKKRDGMFSFTGLRKRHNKWKIAPCLRTKDEK